MKKMMLSTLVAAAALFSVANQAHAGTTLDAIKKKGFIQCGISDGLPASHLRMPAANSAGLMWMCAALLLPQYSVTILK